jgi:hypothetical protein
MKADSPVCKAQIMKMGYIVQDVLHTNLIEWNFGGTKISLEGLPGSVVSILCGSAPPCLKDILGVAWVVLEGVDPPEILQATRWRLSSDPSLSFPGRDFQLQKRR